jgi:hypothetical protein
MKHAMICGWLGLPEDCWPPDHYTLLGLSANESDKKRIEQQVHERLTKVRCYQCSHPEQATEAMNRLAQAFICLSDPEARKAYDASRGKNGHTPRVARINDDTATNLRTRVDWQSVAPPVRSDSGSLPLPQPSVTMAASTPVAEAPAPAAEAQAVEAPAADAAPAAEAIQPPPPPATASGVYDLMRAVQSLEARRGLATLPRLIDRVDETRQLLWVWDQIGKVLKRRRRPLRPEEERELSRLLAEAVRLLERYPKILGRPGQPGYRVVAIAHLNATAHILFSLDKEQRASLAKDWAAARHILLGYRRFLYHEFQTLRRAGCFGRALRAARTRVHDHPLLILASLFVLAALAYFLLW